MKNFFIIDFDSTFVTVEALDELFRISAEHDPSLLQKIQEITRQGMEGKISFERSLARRMELLHATRTDIDTLVSTLQQSISPSVQRNKSFFQLFAENIYIISGGFTDYIIPVIRPFGIAEDHVIANRFIYDNEGTIIGYDKRGLLAKKGGKARAIAQLKLDGTCYVIGDGYTDYEVKKLKKDVTFVAFTETVTRKTVTDKADLVVHNFDELLYHLRLPRTYYYPKSKIKVLLLENVDSLAKERFEEEGYAVQTVKSALSEKELIAAIKDVTILGIRSKTQITEKIIRAGRKLLTIGAFCIGTNQIDVGAAVNKGIPVFNAPYSNTRSVVELILGEIIMLSRKTFDRSTQLHAGNWQKSASGCHEVRGKKLGIVGYGNIGSQLSVLAENLGMEIYYYDIADKLSMGNAKSCASLEELLHIADIVTIHVDGRDTNKNLIGERQFRQMKDGVLFLNASRGFIVDIHALAHALQSGKLAGAAVDVYPEEPAKNAPGFKTPLQKLPNVILTPHVGAGTQEAQLNIAKYLSSKLIQFVNTGSTTLSVNFPQIQLGQLDKAHRLIHVHTNSPGVLAQINQILASYHLNIIGQYLKTDEKVGYVITDVDQMFGIELLRELRKMKETIKVRGLY